MHNYTPSGTAWEALVGLVDDSDTPTATNLNTGPTGNADRSQYLHDHTAVAKRLAVTSSGTWTVPAGVTLVHVEGCGGGGGGGAGTIGETTSGGMLIALGGSGGAGAPIHSQDIVVAPADVVTLTIGAGGAAGSGSVGGDGGSSVFQDGFSIVGFAGGKGGGWGGAFSVAGNATSTADQFLPGGAGPGGTNVAPLNVQPYTVSTGLPPQMPLGAGVGGASHAHYFTSGSLNSYDGNTSAGAQAGGAGAAHAVSTSANGGGAGGGGGGGGFLGPGGAGGAGGAINGSGTGSAGAAGSAASANTGAGGGGGGGGGEGSAGGGAGGVGGAGGSGIIILTWIEYDVHPLG